MCVRELIFFFKFIMKHIKTIPLLMGLFRVINIFNRILKPLQKWRERVKRLSTSHALKLNDKIASNRHNNCHLKDRYLFSL